MSAQDIGKKQTELSELEPFLEAYHEHTGMGLSILNSSESPDFLCTRTDGVIVGIELTKVMTYSRKISWSQAPERGDHVDPFDVLESMVNAISTKENARAIRYSKAVKNNILALQLFNNSILESVYFLRECKEDFSSHGFSEIWLADYTGFDAFHDIELFGLYPGKILGWCRRQNPDRKPFG